MVGLFEAHFLVEIAPFWGNLGLERVTSRSPFVWSNLALWGPSGAPLGAKLDRKLVKKVELKQKRVLRGPK